MAAILPGHSVLPRDHPRSHPAANLGAKPPEVPEDAQEALGAIQEADEEDDAGGKLYR